MPLQNCCPSGYRHKTSGLLGPSLPHVWVLLLILTNCMMFSEFHSALYLTWIVVCIYHKVLIRASGSYQNAYCSLKCCIMMDTIQTSSCYLIFMWAPPLADVAVYTNLSQLVGAWMTPARGSKPVEKLDIALASGTLGTTGNACIGH